MQKTNTTKHATGFTLWMLKWHINDNTQVGILARHIQQDMRWPVTGHSYQEFIGHLETLGADERMIKAMCDAWKMYEEAVDRISKRTRFRENYHRS